MGPFRLTAPLLASCICGAAAFGGIDPAAASRPPAHGHEHLHRHSFASLRNLTSAGGGYVVRHLNSTAHSQFARLKAVLERRRVTDLNRLTLLCVLTMAGVISVCTMVMIVRQRWAPDCTYQECSSDDHYSSETTELADQARGLMDPCTPPSAKGAARRPVELAISQELVSHVVSAAGGAAAGAASPG